LASVRTCSAEGCGRKHYGRSYCYLHYTRFRHHGTPDRMTTEPGAPVAFLEANRGYVGQECLIWPYAMGGEGYGTMRASKYSRRINAHRLMCELAHGKPRFNGAQAAHSCGNRRCVNPAHLRWASIRENMHDKWDHGTIARGEKVGGARLNRDQVLQIVGDPRSESAIARDFNVSKSAVNFIKSGRTWGWLTGKAPPAYTQARV